MTKTLTQLGSSTFINDPDLLLKRDDASGDDKKVTVGEAFASQRAIRQINVGGSSDYTLTTGDTGKPLIEFIGTLTNSINVIVPDTQRNYVFVNSTGGGFGITVKTLAGTGFLFNASDVLYVRCDGVNVVRDLPTLEGGASANFTVMPQVGGAPVVESGSNSDGEWTRWADGTQKVFRSEFPVSVSGVVFTANITFPVPFSAFNYSSSSHATALIGGSAFFCYARETETASSCQLLFSERDGASTTASGSITYEFIGRW